MVLPCWPRLPDLARSYLLSPTSCLDFCLDFDYSCLPPVPTSAWTIFSCLSLCMDFDQSCLPRPQLETQPDLVTSTYLHIKSHPAHATQLVEKSWGSWPGDISQQSSPGTSRVTNKLYLVKYSGEDQDVTVCLVFPLQVPTAVPGTDISSSPQLLVSIVPHHIIVLLYCQYCFYAYMVCNMWLTSSLFLHVPCHCVMFFFVQKELSMFFNIVPSFSH